MDKDTKEILSNCLDLTLKVITYLEQVALGLIDMDKRLTALEAK